jgi:DNA-binding MarR family transcriptional regulator/GNAT superfamily N-acetyltransferase
MSPAAKRAAAGSTADPARDVAMASTIAAVRHFNRLYTRVIGALDEGHLHSEFPLAAVRVLYELAHRKRPNATDIARDLRLDAGYMSRLLRSLDARGLIARAQSPTDGRQTILTLTATGRETVAELEQRASVDVAALLAACSPAQQVRLVAALHTVEALLDTPAQSASAPPYLLRPHRSGDMGWVVARNGALYASEYQWDLTFEALVARITADFIDHFDAAREFCWIAEREGDNVGCVFLVKDPEREGVAKLRILLVEPSARGLGIGKRLVDECTRFARQAGYHTISLWTNDILVSARQLYLGAGYRLVREEPHHSFGQDLVGQFWELAL